MCFYVLDCVFQNELFQRLERGSNCSNQTGETTGLLLPAAGTSLARLYQPRSSTPGLLGQYDDAVSTSDSWGPLTTHHANSSKCHTKFDRPFFIVWWNHCFIAFVLPPLMLYLAFFADVPGRTASFDSESEKLLQINSAGSIAGANKYPPRPGPGFGRITWYMACYDFTWKQLGFTSLWAGFLFLCFNYLWYVGLPLPGVTPAEASAAANSSFAWVYVLSLVMLRTETFDWVKAIAVLGCLGGVVLLAISGWLESLPKNTTHAHHGNHSIPLPKFTMSAGIMVEFACAILQAVYLVAYRKWALRGGKFPAKISALIAGFEGLVHLFVFWIFFVILDYTGVEKFKWPTQYQAEQLAIGASITSTGCIAIMVGLALLPNPLIVSVASLVTTPVQYLADLIVDPIAAKSLSIYDITGGILVILTFGAVIGRDSYLLNRQDKLLAQQRNIYEE